jgi:hypothetical protein
MVKDSKKYAASGGWDTPTSRTANLAIRRCTKPASPATCLPKIATTFLLTTHPRPELKHTPISWRINFLDAARMTAVAAAKERQGEKCEFTNRVRSYATEEMLTFLARPRIPFDQFRAQRQPASIAHNQVEAPLFAASIERAARRN